LTRAVWVVVVEAEFDDCPRCGELAGAILTEDGELHAVDCRNCHLRPSSAMTLWDVHAGRQLSFRPSSLQHAVSLARKYGRMCSVWEGDVRVAVVDPSDGVWYMLGRSP